MRFCVCCRLLGSRVLLQRCIGAYGGSVSEFGEYAWFNWIFSLYFLRTNPTHEGCDENGLVTVSEGSSMVNIPRATYVDLDLESESVTLYNVPQIIFFLPFPFNSIQFITFYLPVRWVKYLVDSEIHSNYRQSGDSH